MNLNKAMSIVTEKDGIEFDLRQQVEAVCYLYLYQSNGSDAYYHALQYLPRRLDEVSKLMFMNNHTSGYQPAVIRRAMKKLADDGFISDNEKPFTSEDLEDYL